MKSVKSVPKAVPSQANEFADAVPLSLEDLQAMKGTMNSQQGGRVDGVIAQMRSRANGPRLKLNLSDEVLKISFDHPDPNAALLLTMADLGCSDMAFSSEVLGQIASIGSHRKRIDEGTSNFVLSVVRGVQPRDELEALLAVQMGAIHSATMMMARRLNLVENIPQQDAAERALNKLARTYAMQMEALKRYRTSGQQKVTVEHVTVNAGGQAIVGAVQGGGGL